MWVVNLIPLALLIVGVWWTIGQARRTCPVCGTYYDTIAEKDDHFVKRHLS